MARFIGYHNTPVANATLTASIKQSLCIAYERECADLYERGGRGVQHYTFEVEIEGSIMSEKKLQKLLQENGFSRYVEDCIEYEATKLMAVRQLIVDEGYDAVCYGDTVEGCNYICCEVVNQDAIVSVTLCESCEE
jgi:hypothetical protein